MNAHRAISAAEPQFSSDDLARRYAEVRAMTEWLAAPLSAEDQMVQSCPEASPVKWHRAHTTWFFETFVLAPHLPAYRPLNPAFRTLFNSYYVNVGERPLRTTRGMMSRPSADDVREYRAQVDRQIMELLEANQTQESASLRDLVELGLHHEQQHQELIVTDITHAFWTNPLRPAYQRNAPRAQSQPAPPLSWIEFDGGVRTVGHAGSGFCFDNEAPRHQVLLRPFRLGSRLVTCGEYLEFIADGGYRTPTLWLSDGWDAVAQHGWKAPLYWESVDDAQRSSMPQNWRQMTCSGMREVVSAEPVTHISFYEADAYARWAGARLATEFEWEAAACGLSSAAAAPDGNFLEDGWFHARVAPHAAAGPVQMLGDAWEWTASPYVAYPGYRPPEGALGEYNGKFMCNQMVLRGGSCATPRSHIRPTYRNFFPPATRWQFSGIRLANDCD